MECQCSVVLRVTAQTRRVYEKKLMQLMSGDDEVKFDPEDDYDDDDDGDEVDEAYEGLLSSLLTTA